MNAEQTDYKKIAPFFIIIILVGIGAIIGTALYVNANGGSFSEGASALTINNPTPFGPSEIVTNQWVLLLALIAASTVLIGISGLLITGIFTLLARSTKRVEESDEFKEHSAVLAKKEKASFAEVNKGKPVTPIPDHDQAEASWTLKGAVLIAGLLFAPIFGAAFSENFLDGRSLNTIAFWSAVIVTLAGFALVSWLNRSGRTNNNSESNEITQPVNYGAIYLWVTATIVIGLGLGVMMWVRGGG